MTQVIEVLLLAVALATAAFASASNLALSSAAAFASASNLALSSALALRTSSFLLLGLGVGDGVALLVGCALIGYTVVL